MGNIGEAAFAASYFYVRINLNKKSEVHINE